jgi:dTDP-4-dehydrorhamnose reductase
MRALIVGGSGYLGQFVIRAMLDAGYDRVDYTYASNPLPPDATGDRCTGHRADLPTGEGLREAIDALRNDGGLDVVVNCAAISSPGACEIDPETANATNVPKQLLMALRERFPPSVTRGNTGDDDPETKKPLLVHVSTDQVYDGSRENNLECGTSGSSKTHIDPVNAYGRSKLAAEKMVLESWPYTQTVILRSSVITGPQSPFRNVHRPLFLDFITQSLEGDREVTFFKDEFRNPIAAVDLARHVLVVAASKPGTCRGVFNAGGPDRVSRVDMAKRTAAALGVSDKNVRSGLSASADRGVKSPLDISMDSSKLEKATGVRACGWELQAKMAAGMPYMPRL